MKMKQRTFWVIVVTTIVGFISWQMGGSLWVFLLILAVNTANLLLSIGGNR